ncbi:HK97 gp10 family phage protein [Pseudolactococcus raffinolactis]|uniref:HK97 gp10 family phage protein n=1 Tax=Pseudolactococcus raffinolactis TaxID=1366 RepID=UPI001108BC57|nr:HK97 gp10 family phage protein [Lactococcus raffinolactis]TLQ15919.1 HK97 gp10 family phage protein [Lactococcus raffinolactis]
MADTRAFEQACDNSVNKMQELLMQNMEQTLDHVAGKAKEKVGVGTGALRADTRSLGVEIVGDEVHGAVGNSLEYAIYHHQGTGIYASDGNGRKTPWVYEDPKTGEKIYTRGSKPNPYLKDTIEQEQSTISKLLGGAN